MASRPLRGGKFLLKKKVAKGGFGNCKIEEMTHRKGVLIREGKFRSIKKR